METHPTPGSSGAPTLPPRLLDSLEVHVAALERGFNVLLLPRQVMLAAYGPPVPADVSFTHGVPEASTVSAVTFAQDRGLRRALVERQGGKNIRGASFSSLSLDAAKAWARKYRYPVTVKELVGENPARAVRGVRNDRELEAAFNSLRLRHESDRAPGKNPSASGYATTRLTFEVNEEGQETAPAAARMLIELDRPGTVIRGFVIGGRVIAAVRLGGQSGVGEEDVTDDLTEDQRAVMIMACEAVPGLACATVDVIVRAPGRRERLRAIIRGPRPPRLQAIEVSERPRAESYAEANPELPARIGSAILEFQAEVAGVALGEHITDGDYSVEIKGLLNPEDASEELVSLLTAAGLDIEVVGLDPNEGTLVLDIEGSIRTLATAMEMLVSGDLISDKAASVKYLRK